MLLVWGFRTKSKVLARLLLVCALCQKPAAQTIGVRKRWFTLFWIPVFPTSTKHLMQCALCGQVSQLTKEEAERLALQAAEQPIESAVATLPAEDQTA